MKWPGVCKNRRPPLKNVNGRLCALNGNSLVHILSLNVSVITGIVKTDANICMKTHTICCWTRLNARPKY